MKGLRDLPCGEGDGLGWISPDVAAIAHGHRWAAQGKRMGAHDVVLIPSIPKNLSSLPSHHVTSPPL